MSRPKLLGIGVLLLATIAITRTALLPSPSRPQVIGTVAPDDLAAILHLVRQEMRSRFLPDANLYNLLHPRDVVYDIRSYRAKHILWVEAHDDREVEVIIGVGMDVIRDRGESFPLRKMPQWEITGYRYWSGSNAFASTGIHLPPQGAR